MDINKIPTIALWVVTAVFVLTSLRIVLRYSLRKLRRMASGEMVWFKVVPESRRSSTSVSSVDQQVNNMVSFANALNSSFPYFKRATASLIWHKDPNDGMIRLFVGMDGAAVGNKSNVIKSLAAGINCRAEEAEGPPEINGDGLAVAFRTSNTPSSSREVPSSVGDVAKALSHAQNLSGTYITTMEFMRNSERNKMLANLAEEVIMNVGESAAFGRTSGNAQNMAHGAVRTSVAACSTDGMFSNSKSILDSGIGSISSLGFKTESRDPGRNHSKLVTSFGLLLLIALGVAGFYGAISKSAMIAMGIFPVLLVLLAISGSDALAKRWYRADFERGEITIPPFFYPSPRRLVHGLIRANFRNDAAGTNRVDNRIAPPSCKQMIPMYGSSLTQMASIPEGVMAIDVETESVPMEGFPSRFEDINDDDIYLGQTGRNQVASISLKDLTYGIFCAGNPGSGKTNLMQVIYAGVSRASEKNSHNLKITPLWAETKGEGALQAWEIVKHNPRAILVEAHNPKSKFRPAMEGRRLTEGASPQEVATNCEALVSALQFTEGEGIKAASKEVLDFSMRIAMFLMPNEIDYLELSDRVDRERPNVIELAYILLGGDMSANPSDKLISLQGTLDLSDQREGYLHQAISTLQPFFDKTHPGFRRAQDLKAAPMNKLTALRNAKDLWTPSPDRQDIYIPQIVRNFAPVVLNMGPYWDPDYTDDITNERGAYDQRISLGLANKCLLAFGFLMWNHINSKCTGWEKEGKRIIMHYDEVADIAVDVKSDDVPNIVAQIAKQGRSKGCALYAAAQHLNQLPEQARHEVMSFRTKVWYQVLNEADIKNVMGSLGQNTPYTGDNIKRLPPQTGIGIAEIKQGSEITPAFTLMTPEVNAWSDILKESPDMGTAIRWYSSEHQ